MTTYYFIILALLSGLIIGFIVGGISIAYSLRKYKRPTYIGEYYIDPIENTGYISINEGVDLNKITNKNVTIKIIKMKES